MNNRFLKFALTGGFAAVVNFGSRFVYSQFAPFAVAVVLAYLTGMITAFVLNRWFVFQDSKQSVGRQAWYFTLVNLLAVVQTVVISVGLAEYLLPWIGWSWYREPLAHAVGIMVPIFTSFWGHKKYSFAVDGGTGVRRNGGTETPFELMDFNFSEKIVLLDIDGTLVPDNTVAISLPVKQAVARLAAHNQVWLCTNSSHGQRNQEIARALALPLLSSAAKKPSRQVLQNLPVTRDNLVVIGDKFLTDELLARRAKSLFIRVARKLNGQERFKIKIINIIDDVAYSVARLI